MGVRRDVGQDARLVAAAPHHVGIQVLREEHLDRHWNGLVLARVDLAEAARPEERGLVVQRDVCEVEQLDRGGRGGDAVHLAGQI